MIYIYIFLILLNTSSAIAFYFNKKIEETIFISIAFKILILFLFGVFINLEVGFYLLMFLNIPCLIYNVNFIRKNRQFLKSIILTPGLFIFILAYLFFIWINHGRLATSWDEFSHWALVVKNMYFLNNFGIGIDSNIIFKNYLSGTSLFQYFCTKLNGGFSESILFFAMSVSSFSLLVPIFKYFRNIKNLSIYLVFIVLITLPTLLYNDSYTSLLVDAILGICFAYSLYSYYFNYEEGLSKFNIVNLSLALVMLTFIKDIGLVLAAITIFIIFIDNLFIKNQFKFNLKSLWNNSKYVFLIFLPCLIVKGLWIATLSINGVSSSLSASSGIFSNLLSLVSLDPNNYKYLVVRNFVDALFLDKLFGTSISISFIVALGLFAFIMYKIIDDITKGSLKKGYTVLASIVIIGAIGYSLVILLSYLAVFSPYEALKLASFGRYSGSYILGILILVFALLIKEYSSSTKKTLRIAMYCFSITLIFANFLPLINMTFYARESVRNTVNMRSSYQKIEDVTNKYLGVTDRLYFISTNDSGFDYYVSRYTIIPIKTNLNLAWSIGEPYYDGDIWTKAKTAAVWRQELLENYNYVYLFDIDEQFINKYHLLFNVSLAEIVDNQLYRVNKSSTSDSILELVE